MYLQAEIYKFMEINRTIWYDSIEFYMLRKERGRMNLITTNGTDKRFCDLCSQLDEALDEAVGGEKQRSQYVQYNQLDDIHDVVLACNHETTLGCGSFKRYDEQTAEIKRVFVKKEFRRNKVAVHIMKELERIAATKGYQRLILETGMPLKAAIKLYESLGYHVIPNYGQYANMDESVCMEKLLK